MNIMNIINKYLSNKNYALKIDFLQLERKNKIFTKINN